MVVGRRRRFPAGAAVWVSVAAVAVAALVAVALTAAGDKPAARRRDGETRVVGPGPARPAIVEEPHMPQPGLAALVTVTVATVWSTPGAARPVDEPSLTNPVDIGRWTAAMSQDDKVWLVDHLVTQALYGARVVVREVAGDWARVVVTGQSSSLDPNGYPGWIPTVQLRGGEPPAIPRSAVVTRPSTALRDVADPSRRLLDLSYNTRLPVLDDRGGQVTVALPTGGRGLLAASDVDVAHPGARPTTGADLVADARKFSGLPYLWAGTSSAGFDCSGFTAAVYGVHGIVLPRDADDQAGGGTPVDVSRLQPGDLLFYSPTAERSAITHVSMYAGGGMMIQAPATGKKVETVPVDTPAYARQFWGARRYLPAP